MGPGGIDRARARCVVGEGRSTTAITAAFAAASAHVAAVASTDTHAATHDTSTDTHATTHDTSTDAAVPTMAAEEEAPPSWLTRAPPMSTVAEEDSRRSPEAEPHIMAEHHIMAEVVATIEAVPIVPIVDNDANAMHDRYGRLTPDEMIQLETACAAFGYAFRMAHERILTVKGHIVEAHLVSFARRFDNLGVMGEDGIEALHPLDSRARVT